MAKQIGYARVSTKTQITDRQQADLLAAGVRRDDVYVDHGVSGARASRSQFDAAIKALHEGTLSLSQPSTGSDDRPRICSRSPPSSNNAEQRYGC